ncbi:quinone oxidoreductase isoform X2 [Nilaparvata lugens]|uniref:quinone oxidoreductase isoform X2 n=1 Tax=Nilaparvata lugens TaxID=108931 RepID=UPI00193E116F|nr:quinone oxidoreductase isoform X2 [Nilaparvata lugens]
MPLFLKILIRVEAAGINPVDTYLREGFFAQLPPLPLILGKEAAGTVAAIGSNVKYNPYNLKVGDRVYCMLPNNGGYAQYVASTPENVVPLPDKLTYCQGASLYVTYYTAYRALILRAKMKKNESVLIHGASGGVGTAAIQMAKHYGAFVAATAGSDAGLELCRSLGADYTINHRQPDHLLVAKRELGDRGFDLIFENVAHVFLGDDGHVLAPEGRIAIVGCKGSIEVAPRTLMVTEGSMIGVSLFLMTPENMVECTKAILQGIEDGWVKPVIAKEYTFHEARQAHHDMQKKSASRGKLVFKVEQESS